MCPLSPRAEALKELVDCAPRAELPAVAADLAAALGAALARAASPPITLVPPARGVPEALLTVEEAAERLHVPTSWMYRHWKRLGFGRKLGYRTVRIEAAALDRWAARQRPALLAGDVTR
jgi:excisionase family DNA binding protein